MRVVMTFLLALLASAGAWADETVNVGGTDYTLFTGGYAIDGYIIPHNANTNTSEKYSKFVDGSKDNKWCVVNSSSSWSTISIDFHTTTPIIPKGYVLTTGGDTKTYTKRNPKTWKVYAKAEPADEWTEIDSRDITAVPADALPVDDTTDKTYSMTSNTASYKYFRFEVMNIVGRAGNDWTFQLAEMQLFGTAVQDAQHNMRFAIVSDLTKPYYTYTGNPIDVAYTVKDYNDNTLTKGTDYTETISPSTVQEAGKYTLTLTGKGSYSGTKVISFEVRRPIQGSGTAADPYLIGSDLDWKTFADWINKENSTYYNKHYKLTADINVTSTVGTSINNYFGGTFDGDGHTITLDLTSDGDYCASFRYCGSGTTIKRLRIAGTINTSHEYAAGLVGYLSNGILNIINCWNSVTINSCKDDDYTNLGGFVGFANSTTNIVNCRFDGKLLGASSNGCGGFVGSPSSSKTLTVSNCLFAPTEVTFGANNSSTFVRNLGVSGKITNSYYTEKLGTEQGTAVGTMTNSELQEALGNGWEISSDKVVPVMDIKNLTAGSIICNTFFPYTGSEITVTPTVKDMDDNTIDVANYSVVISPSTVQASGNYTMTVTGNANGYSGTLTHSFRVALQLSGAGTEAKPYTIATTADWNKFAQIVNEGYNYEGEFVKLTADIDNVTTMVGLREDGGDQLLDAPFKGTFDGNYQTLTAAIVSTATGTGINEQGVAPFHYIKHATIKNLTVAGSITSDSQYAGGLVGWAGSGSSSEKNTITDCVVTATLTIGANSAGGLVGNVQPSGYSSDNYTDFTNCVFAGTIQSSTSKQRTAGGFFGYGSATTYFTNCLENGTYVNLSMMSPRGAYDSYYNNSVTSLYYVNKIGSVSYITEDNGCHQVVTAVPADNIYLTRTIKGYTVYQPAILSDLKDAFAYNDGNPVSISYVLKMGNTAMTKDTDYELTIKNSSDVTVAPEDLKEVGTYTIHFTAKAGNEAGYTGEIVRSFQIIVGESLDGYVFAKDGDDYVIGNEGDLERLAAYVNSSHDALGKTFKLTTTITLTAPHTTIGGRIKYADKSFRGTFDGNKNTINNLTINKPEDNYLGLFGRLGENAVVKDLTVNGYDITGKQYVGAIAGYVYASSSNRATIQNCHVNGMNVGSVANADSHGGIVGYGYYVDITGCTSQGTISTTAGSANYGGIVGRAENSVNVTSCENTASITGVGDKHGGIVGYDQSTSNQYSLCLNTGIVEGSEYKGSIAGYSYSYYCYTNNYYANPCTVKALSNNDYSGHGERVYLVAAGDHLASISAAEEGVVESVLTGKKYYKKGDWTLTLAPSLSDETFVSYACEGGTLDNLKTVDGDHKLTITDQDVTISAVVSSNSGIDIADASAIIPEQRWKGGDPVIPTITLTYNKTPLVLGTDYIVECSNNTDIGEDATVTITGLYNYKGTTTKTFNIKDFPLLDPQADNSETNPYLVATEEDLEALACIVNGGARNNGYYRQTADIVCHSEHTAIGCGKNNDEQYTFKGTFDGKDGETQHTISGLRINKPTDNYQGLFGIIKNAIVKNVVLVDCDITGAEYTGGIAGCMNSNNMTLDNCTVSGAIKVADGKSYDYHGGVVGYLTYGTVDNCVNMASVTGEGGYHGGIVGYVTSSTYIRNSFNAGNVEGTSYVGSLAGRNEGYIFTSYHTAATTGGVGTDGQTTGTDQTDAELVAKITAADGVTLNLPAKPTYVWNTENLYKSGTEVTLNYATPTGKYFDHYTVNSGEISNAGISDGTHTLTGFTEDVVITGSYANDITNLATEGAVIADIADLTYNGSEQHPAPVVTLGEETLQAGTNYTVTYDDGCTNAGTYTVTVTGTGRYTGSVNKTFKINKFDISGENVIAVTFTDNVYAKTGSEIHPVPSLVKCAAVNNATLVLDTDYELSYSDGCIEAGDYNVTLTGKGNYTGTKTFPFTIADVSVLTVHDKTSTSDYVPVYGYYAETYNKCEMVMPASELAAMKGGDINTMKFYLCTKASDSWGNALYRVFLKEVDFTSFASPNDSYQGTDGATIVYEGALDGTKDVMTISFTTPYFYKGGNLLIGIYEYIKGSYKKASFYGEIVDGASIQGHNGSSLDAVSVNQRNFLPKTTFWYTKLPATLVTLTDKATDNSATIDANDGKFADVTLKDRTLYKNGEWNTICLPFNVTLAGSPLEGATAKTLTDASVTGTTVHLTFGDAVSELVAGTPYIIKWNADKNIENPVFSGVIIDKTVRNIAFDGDCVKFNGYYDAFPITAKNSDIYYMTSGSKLKHTGIDRTLLACRAYFQFNEHVVKARDFVLDFGDEQTTGIISVDADSKVDNIYDLGGRKMNNNSHLKKGLYIQNGKKTVIK